jgi:drug/metabolite transporter (DMT)-like permease
MVMPSPQVEGNIIRDTRPDRLTLLAFAISTLLGGNNAIAVRFSNAELPPFFGAAVRFSAAALLLFLIVLAMRLPLPTGRSLLGVLIFGLLQFGVSYAFIYWGLVQISAGLGQVILAVVPLLTFVFAILHRQERFQWRILIGGLIAVGGIAVIFGDRLSANAPLMAMLAMVLAAACFAEAVVLFKTFPKAHPITTNALAMATGAAFLFVISLLWRETPTLPTRPATWIAVLYLILLGSIGTFVLALYVLSRWTATASSYQLVLLPIVTVLFASLLAHETVTIAFVIGGVLVLAGVYVGAIAPPDLMRRLFSRQKPTPEIAASE